MIDSQSYQIPKGRPRLVQVERLVDIQPKISAQLVILSSLGADLVAFSPIEEQERIWINLRLAPDHHLALPGTVTRVCHRESGEWLLRCAFHSKLSVEVIAELTDEGWLEAFETPSDLLPLEAELQSEKDSTRIGVTLQNFNPWGFCAVAPEAVSVGTHLRMVLKRTTEELLLVGATLTWQTQKPGAGFLLGAEFDSIREYYLLKSFLSRSAPDESHSSRVYGLSYVAQVGTVAVLSCYYLQLI